ncbi:MAG: glycosyltransferase family 61 protein [Chitinophagales bacterium]|jgi:capsular polysaccharide biosynthesis protein|nr:glycosyltransferase family 61 protein [Chitinophagales bacterium]
MNKTFFVLSPSEARKALLFDNLEKVHIRNIRNFAVLSFFKHIFRFRYSTQPNLIAVFHIWSLGYHHFIMEVLPKILLHQRFIRDHVLLIPEHCPRFITDTLAMLQIHNTQVIQGVTLYRDLRIIPNLNSGEYTTEQIKLLRAFSQEVGNPKHNSRKIYVTRRNARSRKIFNEEILLDFLSKQGFEILELENLSIQAQIEMFRSATVFVSIHGAALTNMVWMQDRSKIIEIMPYSKENHSENLCYERLSHALNFSYHKVYADKVDLSQSFDRCDVRLSQPQFDEILNHLSLKYIK